jgi:hypothetical protein
MSLCSSANEVRPAVTFAAAVGAIVRRDSQAACPPKTTLLKKNGRFVKLSSAYPEHTVEKAEANALSVKQLPQDSKL